VFFALLKFYLGHKNTSAPLSGDKLKTALFNFARYGATNLICLRELWKTKLAQEN